MRGQELYRIGSKVVASGQPFYGDPNYPVYDATVNSKMLHTPAHGWDIVWLNSRKILCFRKIGTKTLDKCVAKVPKGPVHVVRGWAQLSKSIRTGPVGVAQVVDFTSHRGARTNFACGKPGASALIAQIPDGKGDPSARRQFRC